MMTSSLRAFGPTMERLGLAPGTQAPVYVCWFDPEQMTSGFAIAIARLAQGFTCPGCGGPVDLLRERGVVACVAETPNCRSVSDRCSSCQAQLHFDATPPDERAQLRWPRVAVGAPLDMPNPTIAALAHTMKGPHGS